MTHSWDVGFGRKRAIGWSLSGSCTALRSLLTVLCYTVIDYPYLLPGGFWMDATATITPAPQHMRALERANQVRLARARLKRRVAAGEASVADVVLDAPWEAESMTIADLLTSQRRWGQTRCRKFLTKAGISENRQLGQLTERQRMLLGALLTANYMETPIEIQPHRNAA